MHVDRLPDYKKLTIANTTAKPKFTKRATSNGQRDKGWNDAGIARFAHFMEVVRAQRSREDRDEKEEKVLERLRLHPVHGSKTKKRKQPVVEETLQTTRPALTHYEEGCNVLENVAATVVSI